MADVLGHGHESGGRAGARSRGPGSSRSNRFWGSVLSQSSGRTWAGAFFSSSQRTGSLNFVSAAAEEDTLPSLQSSSSSCSGKVPEKISVALISERTTKTCPILCLGAVRTGTASLAEALRILGFPNVHHGITAAGNLDVRHEWVALDRACDASFPELSTYRGYPFSREEWDQVFGAYDAVTDIASFFAPSLIAAYPEAKVIIVERDPARWLESLQSLFGPLASRRRQVYIHVLEAVTRTRVAPVMCKIEMAWVGAKQPRDLLRLAPQAYKRHYRQIRESVRPGQLLDFQLSDGWEPLCGFLGKEVPELPFPHVNDKAAVEEFFKQRGRVEKRLFLKGLWKPTSWWRLAKCLATGKHQTPKVLAQEEVQHGDHSTAG